MLRLPFPSLAAAPLLLSLLPLVARAEAPSPEVPKPRKWALIVAISEYAPGTGWRTIHSDHDVPLIRAALESRGFTEIRVLSGPAATRQGIVDTVRRLPVAEDRPLRSSHGDGARAVDLGEGAPPQVETLLQETPSLLVEVRSRQERIAVLSDGEQRNVDHVRAEVRKIQDGAQSLAFQLSDMGS